MKDWEPKIALCMPYYNNRGMLEAHYDDWAEYPSYVKDAIEVSICDDTSDEPIEHEYTGVLTHLHRIRPPKVIWSQCCATNIAVWATTAPWVLLTDIDHVVPVDTWDGLRALLEAVGLAEKVVYTFRRKNVDGADYKPHPNSWLMHRSMWEASKGHDERYRGLYNQDHSFRMRLERVAAAFVELPYHLIRVGRETIPDASTPRVYLKNRELDKMKVSEMRKAFLAAGTFWKDTRLTAQFDRIY